MPNGDLSRTREDWEKIYAFFEGLSPVLLPFATAHGVEIAKYYHGFPCWTFLFRHPKDGYGLVEVERVSESTARVNISWHISEYETYTRYFKKEEGVNLPLGIVKLGEVLEESLMKLLAWNRQDLTPWDAKKSWAEYSKEEWLKIFSLDRYPLLKL